MNERVAILRDAVVKITQMLSGKGITVTQRGVNAYVQADKEGRPVLVNLPFLPDNATEELCMAIQGFLDHEVAHILFSDFSLLNEANKLGVHSMLNMLEDARIEKCMAQRFSGSGHNLSVTGKFFLDKFTVPAMKEAAAAGDASKVIGILMVPLIRAMSGQFIFKEFMKDKMPIIQAVYDKIADLQPKIEAATSSRECFELAKEIEKRLRGEKHSGDKNEEGEGEGKGKGKSKSKSKSKPKAAEDSVGEGDGSSSESEEGDKEEEGKGSSKGGKKSEDEEKDEGSSSGSGSKDEESEEEGSEEEKSEEEEGEGEPKSSEEDEEEESEEDEEEEGSDGDASDDGESGEVSTVDTAAIWENLDKDSANDYDKSMSSIISAAACAAAKESSYLIYSKEGDTVETFKIGGGFDSRMLSELSDAVDHMVGPLQKDLERAVAARSLATWENGRRSGRLHAANLSRLAVGDSRVFRRRHETTSKDVAVSLVVDASGSMAGSKIHLATQAAYALSQVLERLNITHEVIAFTTGSPVAGRMQLDEEQAKIGRRFTRTESLYMPILKGFTERLKTDVKERFGWLPNSRILRNNVDGECIEIAARRLMARREHGKVMIVLSDGAPNAHGDTFAMSRHLKKVISDISKLPSMKVVGIGIESDDVQHYYPKSLVINKVSELPDRVIKELRHLLIQ